jgi:hypothetical protein
MDLDSWVKTHGLTSFSDSSNPKISFFYLSLGSETLQFVFEDIGGEYRLDVWALETDKDEELHKVYTIRKDDLEAMLDTLVEAGKSWLASRAPMPG